MSEDYSLAMSTQYSIGVHDGVEIANAKLNEMKDIINKMFDSIQRVRELHIKGTSPYRNNYEVCIWCSNCCEHEGGTQVYYPCPTIEALDGEL